MDLRYSIKVGILTSILGVVLWGCTTPVRMVTKPPPFPEGFMSTRWGSPVEEVKKAIDSEGHRWFKDATGQEPFALYGSGTYLDSQGIFSYFFTPNSKRLYRVDVTFDDVRVYMRAMDQLVQRFREPSFSHRDVTHWSWPDKSLIILQKDQVHAQISYWSGPYLVLKHEETATPGK